MVLAWAAIAAFAVANTALEKLRGEPNLWRLSRNSSETLGRFAGNSLESLWSLTGDPLETLWRLSGVMWPHHTSHQRGHQVHWPTDVGDRIQQQLLHLAFFCVLPENIAWQWLLLHLQTFWLFVLKFLNCAARGACASGARKADASGASEAKR